MRVEDVLGTETENGVGTATASGNEIRIDNKFLLIKDEGTHLMSTWTKPRAESDNPPDHNWGPAGRIGPLENAT
ncbi:hypothetical protein EVAR_55375_1 [Eumeta japonica]|uniref:Uncharacterized protein n=1 Tax=Eumeta variegata TaxID=151549 RepID=A0A4C1YY28_EUMVA|nr:hypothetical protein EVAR_55375_1 [Eumeta japonica]